MGANAELAAKASWYQQSGAVTTVCPDWTCRTWTDTNTKAWSRSRSWCRSSDPGASTAARHEAEAETLGGGGGSGVSQSKQAELVELEPRAEGGPGPGPGTETPGDTHRRYGAQRLILPRDTDSHTTTGGGSSAPPAAILFLCDPQRGGGGAGGGASGRGGRGQWTRGRGVMNTSAWT